LFIHGEKDDFVPYVMLSKVYEAKNEGRKCVFVAENSVHATAYSDHRADYTNAVRDFLMENIGKPIRWERSYPCRLQDVI
ncbi:MAG: alpha/beta hydrolase, partial [Prevotella sp.]|nr:alpha/beta hydrolase [Prevotella sp.]